jgi:hypothetical protein
LDLSSLPKEIHENRNLCAKDLWHDWRKDVIHGAQRVSAADMILRIIERTDEDDRRKLRPRPLADHRSCLEAIHPRHIYVQKYQREFLFQ